MKRCLLTLTLLLLLFAGAHAQNAQWTVKPGESIKEALGDSIIYRYPQFMPGSVYFRNRTVSTAMLNLNLVNGEMQFIDASGDTLSLANEVTTREIVIQADTFCFDKVYLEVIHSNAVAKLARLVAIIPADMQKMGAYGQASSVSSINTASYFYNGNQVSKLTQDRIMILHKKTAYFIGDQFNHFLPADKRNFYRMFNTKKQAMDGFIKANSMTFGKEEDLLALVDLLGK